MSDMDLVETSVRGDEPGANKEWSKDDEAEIVRTLSEIIEDGGFIVGCDILVGTTIKMCGFRDGQFVGIGWATTGGIAS